MNSPTQQADSKGLKRKRNSNDSNTFKDATEPEGEKNVGIDEGTSGEGQKKVDKIVEGAPIDKGGEKSAAVKEGEKDGNIAEGAIEKDGGKD